MWQSIFGEEIWISIVVRLGKSDFACESKPTGEITGGDHNDVPAHDPRRPLLGRGDLGNLPSMHVLSLNLSLNLHTLTISHLFSWSSGIDI